MSNYETDPTEYWANHFRAFASSIVVAAMFAGLRFFLASSSAPSHDAISFVAILAIIMPFVTLFGGITVLNRRTSRRWHFNCDL